jgi:hypothetical protein
MRDLLEGVPDCHTTARRLQRKHKRVSLFGLLAAILSEMPVESRKIIAELCRNDPRTNTNSSLAGRDWTQHQAARREAQISKNQAGIGYSRSQ